MCIVLLVRARKDAKALQATVEKYYGDWPIKVETLGGVRGAESLVKAVMERREKGCLHVVMLGREDWESADILESSTPLDVVVYRVPRSRVRNTRPAMLANMVVEALSLFATRVYWDFDLKTYVASTKPLSGSQVRLSIPNTSSVDVFIGTGLWRKLLELKCGVRLGENPLIVRVGEGVGRHLVFQGPKAVVAIDFEVDSLPSYRLAEDYEVIDIDVQDVLKASQPFLNVLIEWSKTLLKRVFEEVEPDVVVVPWSGGKDSTATLLLALEVIPKHLLQVVYVDTGTEFPQTHKYVELLAEKLGIDVVKLYAGVDRELLAGLRPLPTHDNRWCTGLKLDALKRFLSSQKGRKLVIVGDRSVESVKRSERSPFTQDTMIGVQDIYRVTPLKVWSALHVQLYLLSRGVSLHPLYSMGFYRIGCYICPSLRSWELYAMRETGIHDMLLKLDGKAKIYRLFLERRGVDVDSRCSE